MKNKIYLLFVALSHFLEAGTLSDVNDDVLLLTQISPATHNVCITPLKVQKDGSSRGCIAQWVEAEFFDKAGKHLTGEVVINWTLGMGGNFGYEASIDTLYVKPHLPLSMQEVLGIEEGEVLCFKLNVTGNEVIKPSIIMFRKLDGVIKSHKKISLPAKGLSKGLLSIQSLNH